jgi:NAD(P)H-dependent FMN reductase
MHIQMIIASVREGRRGRAIGEWAYQAATARKEMSVELVDLKEWNFPMFSLAKPPIMGDYSDPLQLQSAPSASGLRFLWPASTA